MQPPKLNKKYLLLGAGIALILVISLLPSVFFYIKYRELQKIMIDPALAAKEEARVLKETVGKLMIVPQDEEPLVVTVMDKTKLGDQPFFAKAQNGDKILIFQNAKLAILYNPYDKKIVQVGPFTPPSPTTPPIPQITGEEQGNFSLPSLTPEPSSDNLQPTTNNQ